MHGSTELGLITLVRLYLQNEHSFVVRRHLQRFVRGEISAQEAVARIREEGDLRDDEEFPVDVSTS